MSAAFAIGESPRPLPGGYRARFHVSAAGVDPPDKCTPCAEFAIEHFQKEAAWWPCDYRGPE